MASGLLRAQCAGTLISMRFRLAAGSMGVVVAGVLFASVANAQCSKDIDCKGDRVCENGACVVPAPAAPPAVPVPAAAPPAALPPPPPAPEAAAPAVAAAPAPAYAPPAAGDASVARPVVTTQRHSTGMMAVGIVMVSFAPITLIAAMVASFEKADCENGDYLRDASSSGSSSGRNCDHYDTPLYTSLLGGAALLGVGLPLIVIGGKREPIGTARLTPWASPHGGGLGLRFDL